MTALYIADIASWQRGINLDVVKAAGFGGLNIKTSQGNWYRFADAPTYAESGRSKGFKVGTFHWLDNSASGAGQAALSYQYMKDCGGPDDMWHQCDCEDTATYAIWRDYVNAMQDYLGRHIINYTGDWWWQPKGWTGADLTPYLWAAPNAGYRTSYPGDSSSDWTAGYGGWPTLSMLQYAVLPIPNSGDGNVSLTTVRDSTVLAALMGESTVVTTDEAILKKVTDYVAEWEVLRNKLSDTRGAFTKVDDIFGMLGVLGEALRGLVDQVSAQAELIVQLRQAVEALTIAQPAAATYEATITMTPKPPSTVYANAEPAVGSGAA